MYRNVDFFPPVCLELSRYQSNRGVSYVSPVGRRSGDRRKRRYKYRRLLCRSLLLAFASCHGDEKRARPISSARGAVAPNRRTIPTPGGTPASSHLSRELRGHLSRLASAAVDFDRRAGAPFSHRFDIYGRTVVFFAPRFRTKRALFAPRFRTKRALFGRNIC